MGHERGPICTGKLAEFRNCFQHPVLKTVSAHIAEPEKADQTNLDSFLYHLNASQTAQGWGVRAEGRGH